VASWAGVVGAVQINATANNDRAIGLLRLTSMAGSLRPATIAEAFEESKHAACELPLS
jgi:hypothetical protein